jgi:multiple sugar transport system permease protein
MSNVATAPDLADKPDAPRNAGGSTNAAYDSRNKTFNRICFGVLIVFSIIWLIPLLWAVDTALKPNAETTIAPVTWWIENPTLQAFQDALSDGNIWRWYMSSFITSAAVAVGTVITASMAAFALSRMRFRGRGFAFFFVLVGIMIPGRC